MSDLMFGLRVNDFPVDGTRGRAFVDQLLNYIASAGPAYTSLFVSDHFVPWAQWQPSDTDLHECWTTMSFLAATFPDKQIGSIVMAVGYRSPALVAKMAATLQVLSGGRLILGLGAGWKEDEYLAYGYEFPRAAIRIAQLEEALQIIRRLWTQSPATFEGRYYRVRNAYCEPRPEPIPPILIGAAGERRMLRLVAQYADWYNLPGGDVARYARKLEVLRQHCAEVGRDYESIIKSYLVECVAVAQDPAEARRWAEKSPFCYHGGAALVGTPEEVTEQLRAFARLGVRHFLLRFADFPHPEGAQLFAREVIPRLVDKA